MPIIRSFRKTAACIFPGPDDVSPLWTRRIFDPGCTRKVESHTLSNDYRNTRGLSLVTSPCPRVGMTTPKMRFSRIDAVSRAAGRPERLNRGELGRRPVETMFAQCVVRLDQSMQSSTSSGVSMSKSVPGSSTAISQTSDAWICARPRSPPVNALMSDRSEKGKIIG